jgi:hypothetical protein
MAAREASAYKRWGDAPLIGADTHCGLDRVIANKELGQRQRVALGTVSDIDAADLVTQMPGLGA